MKISRDARNKYLIGDFNINDRGSVIFDGDIQLGFLLRKLMISEIS